MFKWLKKLFGLDTSSEVATYQTLKNDDTENLNAGMRVPQSYEASSRSYLKDDLFDRKKEKNTSSSSSPI